MIAYSDLIKKYPSSESIPYSELIQSREWFAKRETIIVRDNHHCTICGKSSTVDHPHYNPNTGVREYIMFTDIYPTTQDESGNIIESDIPIIDYLDKPYSLHVHHKYYILDRLPWEYPDVDLVTLCNWCHWQFHGENIVPVYRNSGNKLEQINLTPCSRCHGAGLFPEYSHVQSGVCFKCKGKRYEELITND